MEQALTVLRQDGVLGVFPEGGIWRTGRKQAQKGVAWLSYRGRAPILPMGFGGMQGALEAMLRLRRPRFSVTIGRVMPAVELEPGRPRRESFDEAARRVLEAVVDLLPAADRPRSSDVGEEGFALEVALHNAHGDAVDLPDSLRDHNGAALSQLLYTPALIVVFRDRLDLPVKPLQRLESELDAGAIGDAADSVLGYLENDNPFFLT